MVAILQTPIPRENLLDLSDIEEIIPNEIIVDCIFGYLDLYDLFNFKLVNKKYNELIKNYFTNPRNEQLVTYTIKITDKTLQNHFDALVKFLKHNKHNIAFDCSRTNIQNSHFKRLATIQNLQNHLVELNLCNCSHITDCSITSIQKFKNLKKLIFSCCIQITDNGVNKAMENLKNLQEFALSYCRNVKKQTIKKLQKKGLVLRLKGINRMLPNSTYPPKLSTINLLKLSQKRTCYFE